MSKKEVIDEVITKVNQLEKETFRVWDEAIGKHDYDECKVQQGKANAYYLVKEALYEMFFAD